jgi:hypothetical protein
MDFPGSDYTAFLYIHEFSRVSTQLFCAKSNPNHRFLIVFMKLVYIDSACIYVASVGFGSESSPGHAELRVQIRITGRNPGISSLLHYLV